MNRKFAYGKFAEIVNCTGVLYVGPVIRNRKKIHIAINITPPKLITTVLSLLRWKLTKMTSTLFVLQMILLKLFTAEVTMV